MHQGMFREIQQGTQLHPQHNEVHNQQFGHHR
jgi:hypothetical protein